MNLNLIKKNSAKIQASISTIVKIVLVLSLFYATYFHLWHILTANFFLLLLLFMPYFLKKRYQVHIPKEFEYILIIFIISTFFMGSIRGIIIQTFFGISVGFIGFTAMLILFSNSKFKNNYFLIVIFTFSFSVTFGLFAEMAKYYLKLFLEIGNVLEDYPYTMMNLTLVSFGALFSSIIGYLYMKGYRPKILKILVGKFKTENPNFFISKADSPEEILNLIKKGESEKLEFKSTLRTNLHTGEFDKKIELAVLKTIVAFLNSEGGILLVGVSDKGEISGLENDKFENNDKFNRHFTNMIKEKIGNEYIPFLNFEIIPIKGKNVLKVECKKSDKPVFLKDSSGSEEFYIRLGASSNQISGIKLIEYIKHNFK